jgi:hypothetical protein
MNEGDGQHRALLAADLVSGALIVTPLPIAVANALTGAGLYAAKAARSLLPAERAAALRREFDLPWRKDDFDERMGEMRRERVIAALKLADLD